MQVNAGGSYPDGIVLIDKDTGLPYNASGGSVSIAGDAIPVTGATTAISTAIVDGSGNQITSFGGGVQYTEGDIDATITGTAMMMEGAGNALVAAPGTAADGLLVNLGTNNDVVVTGTVAVTQSGTWDEVGINDSGNSITVDAPVGTPVFVRLSDGSSAISTLPISITPQTSGGLSVYHLISAATTNATVVKASAGQLFGWYIHNSNAAVRKVAFHNASSTPTAGASIFFTLSLPPAAGANVMLDTGIAFSTGIAITTVTGMADNDTTAVSANDLNINLFYK